MSMTIVDGVTVVRCDARANCDRPIARIDQRGFVYCAPCGQGEGRKLRPSELRTLASTGQIKRY